MRHWSICLALALAGPTVAAAQAQLAALVANPPLATTAVTIRTDGRSHRYIVELARTAVEQGRGLMLRKAMARNRGMLFPLAQPREAAFWMEGTILPLDLIFIAPDKTVRRIAANAVPYDRAEIPSGGPVTAVLELNAGEAARIGLRPGDRIDYTIN